MMKLASRLALTALLASAASAHAGTITDLGNFGYWGGHDHKLGDAIGGAAYDIKSASVTRAGSQLTVTVATNFAGHAGSDAWAAAKGIGYGDVFLAAAWHPFGSDAHHLDDNAANGTTWTYALNLDNRWSNTGGSFTLYELNGASNAANVLTSESFLSCTLGTQCYYRDGQATAVNTASSSVHNTGLTGTWSVNPNSGLLFNMDLGGSALASLGGVALHWGETCQNDVIEGFTAVPEPTTPALIGLALAGLALRRKARAAKA